MAKVISFPTRENSPDNIRYRDNEYVLTGYRYASLLICIEEGLRKFRHASYSLYLSVQSILKLHNETGKFMLFRKVSFDPTRR